jgi:hypothetical protein
MYICLCSCYIVYVLNSLKNQNIFKNMSDGDADIKKLVSFIIDEGMCVMWEYGHTLYIVYMGLLSLLLSKPRRSRRCPTRLDSMIIYH